jgi:hypothetical protein
VRSANQLKGQRKGFFLIASVTSAELCDTREMNYLEEETFLRSYRITRRTIKKKTA